MQSRPPRPTGVTILGVVSILFGIGGLLVGAVLLAASAIVSTLDLSATYPQLASYGLTSGTIAVIIGIVGAVFLILGILDLVMGIGFFSGKGWAWTLGMIVAILNIIGGIGEIFVAPATGVVWLVIWIGILYYVTRPRVKAYFGKAPWGPPSMGGPSMMTASPMAAPTSSPMGTSVNIKCSACGAMAPAGSTKCPNCGAML